MSYTYLLPAISCPAPQVPLTVLTPSDALPTRSKSLGSGDSAHLVSYFNQNAAQVDANARYGRGMYAVAWGLDLSDGGGLTLNISLGEASIDGCVPRAATTLSLINGVVNYIWLSRGGTVNKKLSSDTSPLTAPDVDTSYVYLGAVPTYGNTITSLDRSGVITLLQGNLGFRRTADAGEPTDTPPAGVRFYTVTAGGLYLWDGTQYWANAPSVDALTSDLSSLQFDVLAQGRLLRQLIFALGRSPLGPFVLANLDLRVEFLRALSEAP